MLQISLLGKNSSSVLLNHSVFEKADIFEVHYYRDLIGHCFMGIAALAISCIGLIGNLLSIGVLTSKYMKGTTTNLYLIALAASDASMLLFVILVGMRDARKPMYGVPVWLLWNDAPFVPKLYPICHAFALLFQVCSNWLTAAFTADRYLMICHPFIAKRWCTLRLSKMVISAVFIASFCYTLPRFYEYEYFTQKSQPLAVSDPMLSLPDHWYRLSALGESDSFRLGYHLGSWCVLIIGLPSFFIAVLNIFLVKEINRSIKRMRFEQGAKTRRHETDVMLIGVIVIFFVCQIPSSVSHVMWGIWTVGKPEFITLPWMILNEVGNLFVILNASINIIPYYLFSKRFRVLFMMIYFGWIKPYAHMQRRVNSLSGQLLPPSTSNGRPRIPSRANVQALSPTIPLYQPPLPPNLPLNKSDSCPFILIHMDRKKSAFM